jgi:hypothetical protein
MQLVPLRHGDELPVGRQVRAAGGERRRVHALGRGQVLQPLSLHHHHRQGGGAVHVVNSALARSLKAARFQPLSLSSVSVR